MNIKKIILVLSLTLFLGSCSAKKQYVMSVMSKVYIGMTITEFNQLVPKKELISMQSSEKGNIAIYKIGGYNWYDHDNADGTGDHRFFYFTDNKLNQVDKGERATDLKIKIEK